MKKRLTVVLCMMACILGMALYNGTTIAKAEQSPPVTEEEKAFLAEDLKNFIGAWSNIDFDVEIKSIETQQEMENSYQIWKDLKETAGAFVDVEDTVYEMEEGLLHIKSVAVFENETLTFAITYNPDTKTIEGIPNVTSSKEDVGESFGEKMKKAGLNTLMGILIVFATLFFISLVISLFKFIPRLQEKFRKQEEEKEAVLGSVDQVMTNIEQQEEENLDQELVAVITAAIAASMGDSAPADGLVVRSIRCRNTRNGRRMTI